MSKDKNIKAGDLYKVINVAGREFEILYMDMGSVDPESKGEFIPDFPFFEQPEYIDDRYPFTNTLNDCCDFYRTENTSPNKTCQDCVYFKDVVEMLGVCRCTACRLRKEPSIRGKPINVAVVGCLPTAEKVVREAYGNVRIVNYKNGCDFASVPQKYDLVLVKSFDGEGLGAMGLNCNYVTDGETVSIPVRLLDEPLCRSAEAELSTLIKSSIIKKVNGDENEKS